MSHVPVSSPTATEVVLLKLNRPQKFNAVTEQMIEELVTVYGHFDSDDRIKAIVVTGAGKAFCVGADLEVGFAKIRKTLDGGSSQLNSYRDGYVIPLSSRGILFLCFGGSFDVYLVAAGLLSQCTIARNRLL